MADNEDLGGWKNVGRKDGPAKPTTSDPGKEQISASEYRNRFASQSIEPEKEYEVYVRQWGLAMYKANKEMSKRMKGDPVARAYQARLEQEIKDNIRDAQSGKKLVKDVKMPEGLVKSKSSEPTGGQSMSRDSSEKQYKTWVEFLNDHPITPTLDNTYGFTKDMPSMPFDWRARNLSAEKTRDVTYDWLTRTAVRSNTYNLASGVLDQFASMSNAKDFSQAIPQLQSKLREMADRSDDDKTKAGLDAMNKGLGHFLKNLGDFMKIRTDYIDQNKGTIINNPIYGKYDRKVASSMNFTAGEHMKRFLMGATTTVVRTIEGSIQLKDALKDLKDAFKMMLPRFRNKDDQDGEGGYGMRSPGFLQRGLTKGMGIASSLLGGITQPLASTAVRLGEIGAIATAMTMVAADVVQAWLTNERQGVGRIASTIASIFGGDLGTKTWGQALATTGTIGLGLYGLKLGMSKGGFWGGLVGGIIGTAMGVTLQVIGPDKIADYMRRTKETLLKWVDNLFGTKFYFDTTELMDDQKTLKKGLNKTAEDLKTVSDQLSAKVAERDKLLKEGQVEQGLRIDEEVKNLERKQQQLREHFVRLRVDLEQKRKDLERSLEQEQEEQVNRLMELGKDLKGADKKLMDAIIAHKKRVLDQFDKDRKEIDGLSVDPKTKKDTNDELEYDKKGFWRKLWEFKAIDYSKYYDKTADPGIFGSTWKERMPPVTAMAAQVNAARTQASITSNVQGTVVSPPVVQQKTTNNVASSQTNIYQKTDPYGISDPLSRHIALGFSN